MADQRGGQAIPAAQSNFNQLLEVFSKLQQDFNEYKDAAADRERNLLERVKALEEDNKRIRSKITQHEQGVHQLPARGW